MLFRLADPLADKLAEVDLVEVYPPLAGHQLGGHRLSGAGRPGKKCNEAPAEAHLAVELHLLKEGAPDLQPVANLFDLPPREGRQDEVVEARLGPEIGRAHVELQSLMRNSYAVFCLKKKK